MTRRHIAALALLMAALAGCGAPVAAGRQVAMPVRVLSAPTTPTIPAPAPTTTAPVTATTAPRVVPTPTTAPTPTTTMPPPTTAPPTPTTPTPTTPTAVLAAAISRYVPPADLSYLRQVGWKWSIGTRGCPTRVSLGCTWDTGGPSSQFSPALVSAGPTWIGWIVTHEAGNALLLATTHLPVSSWATSGGWAAQFAATPTARGAPYSPYDAAAGCLSKAWGAPMESPPDTPVECPAATATWVAAQVAQAISTG